MSKKGGVSVAKTCSFCENTFVFSFDEHMKDCQVGKYKTAKEIEAQKYAHLEKMEEMKHQSQLKELEMKNRHDLNSNDQQFQHKFQVLQYCVDNGLEPRQIGGAFNGNAGAQRRIGYNNNSWLFCRIVGFLYLYR